MRKRLGILAISALLAACSPEDIGQAQLREAMEPTAALNATEQAWFLVRYFPLVESQLDERGRAEWRAKIETQIAYAAVMVALDRPENRFMAAVYCDFFVRGNDLPTEISAQDALGDMLLDAYAITASAPRETSGEHCISRHPEYSLTLRVTEHMRRKDYDAARAEAAQASAAN